MKSKVFSGQTVIVTGGARGIGLAICQAFGLEGARVVIADVDLCAAQSLESELSSKGCEVLVIEVDVTDQPSVNAMVEKTLQVFGGVHVLVNNAGICPLTHFEEISEKEWQQVMDVNLKGAFLCSQAVVGQMKAQSYGRIVSISSVAGKMGGVLTGAHYAASKAGLIALTFCIARTYVSNGITANAICPATVETDLTKAWTEEQRSRLVQTIPAGRFGCPGDVSRAVLFVSAPEAGFITGEVIDVNGGLLMD